MPDQPSINSIPSSPPLDRFEENESEEITELIYEPPAPFPNKLRPKKHFAPVEKALEIFKQVKVSISLLDIIEHMSPYAKFLKNLCTKKRAT